jgi:hypothetical protein
MEILQHTEGYSVKLDAAETLEIKINGVSAKIWTVSAGKTAQVQIKFDEEIEVVP